MYQEGTNGRQTNKSHDHWSILTEYDDSFVQFDYTFLNIEYIM